MDFILGFPKARECNSIFVVVDRFSKYSVFMAASEACPAEEATNLFFSHVVKHFDLPKDIISYWGCEIYRTVLGRTLQALGF